MADTKHISERCIMYTDMLTLRLSASLRDRVDLLDPPSVNAEMDNTIVIYVLQDYLCIYIYIYI